MYTGVPLGYDKNSEKIGTCFGVSGTNTEVPCTILVLDTCTNTTYVFEVSMSHSFFMVEATAIQPNVTI